MKVSWSLCLVTGLVAGVILGSYLSHPDRQPVLRGDKISLPEFLQSSGHDDSPVELTPLPESSTGLALWHDETEPVRPALNLSLPEMDWDNQEWRSDASSYPDFFRSGTEEPRLNVSGRLHWDESEEAETLPLTDTILGAEVEFQVRLP